MAIPEQLLQIQEMRKEPTSRIFRPKNFMLSEVEDRELLQNIPAYNIESLFRNINKFKVSVAGKGHYSVVFRLQSLERTIFPEDMTIKLFRFNCPTTQRDVRKLLKATGEFNDNFSRIAYRLCSGNRDLEKTYELIQRQAAGHRLGALLAPENIDAPICLWIKNQPEGPEPVGYSLPFIEGESIKIADNTDASHLANILEENYNLYLGSRGEHSYNESYNAIVSSEGVIKFIDVRITDPTDYSLPL